MQERRNLLDEERVEETEAQQGKRCTKLCLKWSCVAVVSLLALVVAGVVGGLIVHYTITSQQTEQAIMQHVTYEVIGSMHCNDKGPGTYSIYSGNTVGYQSNNGDIDFRCMPKSGNIHYDSSKNTDYTGSPHTKVIFGEVVRYNTFLKDKNNRTAACALCQIDGREVIEMLPATNNCSEGWTREYKGYLMTGGLCVSMEMDWLDHRSSNFFYIYHEVLSDEDVSTDYKHNLVLSCAVCSK